MKCPKCNTKNPDDSKYCRECAAPLKPSKDVSVTKTFQTPTKGLGKDTVIGAFSSTIYNQILSDGWIYFGIPAIKLKRNKYAEERRDVIIRRDVDEEKKFTERQDVNIDEEKKKLVENNHKEDC